MKTPAAVQDLIAALKEAAREWKRRRWLRRQRASANLPF